jgi:hypothetical protein
MILSVACLASSSLVAAGGKYAANYVGWSWRTGGTHRLHENYLSALVYYNLQVDKAIDNPYGKKKNPERGGNLGKNCLGKRTF